MTIKLGSDVQTSLLIPELLNCASIDSIRNISSHRWYKESSGEGSPWSRCLYFPTILDPLMNVDEMDEELLKAMVDFTLPFLSGVHGEEECE